MSNEDKKTLGIALGGGGARGFAHLGVLQVLDEHDIDVRVVTGTSIGALVGAAYAADKLQELVEFAIGVGISDLPSLLSPTLSSQGFFSGKGLEKKLDEIVQVTSIESLDKTFAAVSVDLNSYQVIRHVSGSIYQAVRASISIPGLFTPVQAEDRLLVDGGVLDPVPVAAAFDLGADVVIAVDLFGEVPPRERRIDSTGNGTMQESTGLLASAIEKLRGSFGKSGSAQLGRSYFEILQHTLEASQRALTVANFKESTPDVVISPEVSHIGFLDFHKGAVLVEKGRQAIQPELEKIQAMLT